MSQLSGVTILGNYKIAGLFRRYDSQIQTSDDTPDEMELEGKEEQKDLPSKPVTKEKVREIENVRKKEKVREKERVREKPRNESRSRKEKHNANGKPTKVR